MAALAQRLPVSPIPEQTGIAFVRNDVVNNRGDSRDSSFAAINTQRIGSQKLLPSSAPL